MKRTMWAAFALMIAAGCAKSGSDASEKITNAPAPSASTVAGMKQYEVDGMSISVPKNWVALDPSKADFASGMDRLAKESPNLSKILSASKAMAANKAFKLFVFDKEKFENGFVDNINIVAMPVPSGTTLDKLVTESKGMLAGMGTLVGEGEDAPGGQPFHHLILNSSMSSPKGAPLQMASYFTIANDRQIVVTFTHLLSHGAEKQKLAGEVMKTFRLKG